MERLTNSIDFCQMHCDFGRAGGCFFKDKTHCYDNNIYNRLREYEIAEEQGLLLRLPCKIGDKVYTPCAWGIESGVVGSIEIISDRVFINNEYGAMIGEAHNVFLTKEEALEKFEEEDFVIEDSGEPNIDEISEETIMMKIRGEV